MSFSSSSWVRPQNPSPDLKVALTFLSAMEQCNEAKLMDTFDETLQHQILPISLRRPLLNKALFGEYFRGFASKFQHGTHQRIIHEVIEAQDTIIMHVSGNAISITGEPYQNEYMFILRMMTSSKGDGSRKIGSVKEFVDSRASYDFFREESRRAKQKEANVR